MVKLNNFNEAIQYINMLFYFMLCKVMLRFAVTKSFFIFLTDSLIKN